MLVSAQVDRGFRNIDYDPRALRKPLEPRATKSAKWQERSLPGEPFQRPGNTRASRQAACRDRSACGFSFRVCGDGLAVEDELDAGLLPGFCRLRASGAEYGNRSTGPQA